MNNLSEKILKAYSINKDIKILVNYIKPSFLFKTNILTPIHLGRSIAKDPSKDGTITQDDLKWLYDNCIGDDNFNENISYTNRRVGFLTGTYWAYKNYDKLGNPEYFGSFGYRRLLDYDCLRNLEQYDLILPKKKDFKFESLKSQFISHHNQKLYDMAIKVFAKVHNNELSELKKYFEGTKGYFDELYIIKKDLFFIFCNWIFPLLFEYLKEPQIILNNNDYRDIGFIMERICGYYFDKLTKSDKIKYLETNVIITQKLTVNKDKINRELLAKLRKNTSL